MSSKEQQEVFQTLFLMHMYPDMIGSIPDFPSVCVARCFFCVVGQTKSEIHQNHPHISRSDWKKPL